MSSSDSEVEIETKPLPKPLPKRGVIYLGHIPHGFYEKEMRRFFSQFGEILRLRLGRSKRTGRSKGFAFVEFKDADVAPVVAEAMDGYLLSQRILTCKVVPSDEIHPKLFKGVPPKRSGPSSSQKHQEHFKKSKEPVVLERRRLRLKDKDLRLAEKLSNAGFDFPFAKYK
ncbi:hypothetical protein GEMRC1_007769 [Eukaryota sp. GEM-RC1]